MVMSAKADLTHVCWALRPAASQTLQRSASAEDQLHLAFRGGHLSKLYHKNQTKKGGHHVAAEACHYDLVTTGHDHLHADAEGRATRLRTPGHKVGSVGQPGE